MCCQTVISPVDPSIVIALLAVGQFSRVGSSDLHWYRALGLDENNRPMGVKAMIEQGRDGSSLLRLYVEPSISQYAHHQSRREQASMALEIAARVAEKVGAEIRQLANVTGCVTGGVNSRLLAHYPEMPLRYENLCAGFLEVYGLAI